MVRTTQGAVDGPDKLSHPRKLSTEDKAVKNSIEVDDATWGRIIGQASIQQSSPADVVTRAIEMAYGHDMPSGAVNSGRETDPRLAK
jgi:hypothetical protein